MAGVAVYACPVCATLYNNPADAIACAAWPLDETFKPGDMVTISEGYAWTDNSDWIAETYNDKRDGRKTHNFYFIVTAVCSDIDQIHLSKPGADNRFFHRTILHVATGGSNISRERNDPHYGFRLGWTNVDTHRAAKPARKAPRALYEQAKHLIGMKTRDLL